MGESTTDTDLSIWLRAPKERTAAYFPTYAAISRRIQAALRQWTRDWFYAHLDILTRPYTAQPILVYICTHPFRGKPTNTLTYDVHAGMLDAALSSAAFTLGSELKNLKTDALNWAFREVYFPYRSDAIVEYVRKNSRVLVKMLNIETAIIDALLAFAVTNVRSMGLDAARVKLLKTLVIQLKRFPVEMAVTARAGDIVCFATEELTIRLSAHHL